MAETCDSGGDPGMHHVPAAQVLPPGKHDLKGPLKREIFACKGSCDGQMVWIKEWANPNFSLRKRKEMKPSYLRAAFGITGPKTKHLQVSERGLLCTMCWLIIPHELQGCGSDTSRAISSLTGLGPSLLSSAQTLARGFRHDLHPVEKKKRILSVPLKLAHNRNFSQPDASGYAGMEPGSGNRWGKEGVWLREGIGNMEREKASRQEFSLHESWHRERQGGHTHSQKRNLMW